MQYYVPTQKWICQIGNDRKAKLGSALWLKILEKVSFSIASEASYVYILSLKFIENTKKWPILQAFWKT